MSDVREAAKRYRAEAYQPGHFGNADRRNVGYLTSEQGWQDRVTLSNWAVEQILHDDEEPLSEEWLRSVGFGYCAHWGAMNIGDWRNSMALEWDHGKWSLRACRKGGGCDFRYELPAPTNRHQLRSLCRSLGVQLRDTGASTPGP
jgi:hypothetical protein